MGRSRSSSKRQSSKRKSSKISSEARQKKRTRRTKSKKLHRQDDSGSISSFNSEDEYSRARSRTRGDVKGSRKRSRRSSSSRGSSEDCSHVKKRKGSKRSAYSDSRKKSQKKKHRREPSVSSMSSGSTSKGNREFERPRGRSREKRKDKRGSGKAKSGTGKNKNRSMSGSSCSRCSDTSGCSGKDILLVENCSRRLRSVITVTKSPEDEEKEWDKDGHKEEIVYDHDDYPSCRSNDSNDGGSKRELVHHSHVDFERKVENVKGEGALVSDVRMTELAESGEEGGSRDYQSNSCSDGAGAHNCSKEKKSEVFPTLSSSNEDDLESILRLKALENLRNYRGGLQTNAKPHADEKNKSDSDVKELSTAKIEFVQNRSPKEDGSRVVGATRVLDQNPRSTMGRDSSHPATSYGKVQEGKGSVTESGSASLNVICPPNQVALSGNSKEDHHLSPAGDVTHKSEQGKSALRQESSGRYSIMKQIHKANMLVTESNVKKSSPKTSKIVGQTSNNDGVGIKHVYESCTTEPPSSLQPTLEEQSSKERQGEDKEEFKQKTMSVMRGGEMVQVSYKVYIPKKAPALSRRQLRQ